MRQFPLSPSLDEQRHKVPHPAVRQSGVRLSHNRGHVRGGQLVVLLDQASFDSTDQRIFAHFWHLLRMRAHHDGQPGTFGLNVS